MSGQTRVKAQAKELQRELAALKSSLEHAADRAAKTGHEQSRMAPTLPPFSLSDSMQEKLREEQLERLKTVRQAIPGVVQAHSMHHERMAAGRPQCTLAGLPYLLQQFYFDQIQQLSWERFLLMRRWARVVHSHEVSPRFNDHPSLIGCKIMENMAKKYNASLERNLADYHEALERSRRFGTVSELALDPDNLNSIPAGLVAAEDIEPYIRGLAQDTALRSRFNRFLTVSPLIVADADRYCRLVGGCICSTSQH